VNASYSDDCHGDSILHTKISGNVMESEEEMKWSQYYESRKYLVMTKTRLDRRSRSFWHCYLNWKANQSLLLAYTSVAFQPYTDRQTDRQTDRETIRQVDRKTERQVGRQAGRQAGRPIEKQTLCSLGQPVKQSANPLADILTYLSADALSSSLMCVNVWLGVTSSASNTLQK